MKLSRILLTGALSVSMLAMGAVGAFAGLEDSTSEQQQLDMKTRVSKEVTKVESGVTIPKTTFTFTFTDQFGLTGAPDDAKDGPDIKSVTVEVDSSKNTFKSDDINISSLFDDNYGTGRYVYKVVEDQTNAKPDGAEYGWVKNDQSFTLQVFKQANGKIKYTIHNDNENKKVDGTNEEVEVDGDNKTINVGEFLFKNTYIKRAGDDPSVPNEDEDSDERSDSLVVSKALKGENTSASQEFTFTITYQEDAINKNNGATVDLSDANKVDKEGNITKATLKGNTFTLKGGEKMVFNNIPAGTKVTVVETAVDGYTIGYVCTSDGNGNASNENMLLGEKTNKIEVTNTSNDIDITGLVMNNAPYVALIALALAMAAAYIMIRRRRAGEME